MIDGCGIPALLWSAYRRETVAVVTLVAIAALFQAATLFVITGGVAEARAGADTLFSFALAVGLLVPASLLKIVGVFRSVRLGERASADIVREMAARIARADLDDLDGIARDDVYGRITGDIRSVTSAVWALTPTLQSLMLIVASLIFLFLTAPQSALLLTGLCAVAGFAFSRRDETTTAAAVAAEDRFFGCVDDLFHGFKELKVDEARCADFYASALDRSTRRSRRLRKRSGRLSARHILVVDTLVYGSIGVIAFVLPQLELTAGLATLTAIVAYLVDRLDYFMIDLPILQEGDDALKRLAALLKRLPDREAEESPVDAESPATEAFLIELRGVTFSYGDAAACNDAARNDADDTPFTVGPFDLRIERPEIVFIVGGNGSGKTTLLKLLTGLYKPSGGRILIDREPASSSALQSLFAAVFTDFHLFRRVYIDERGPDYQKALFKKLRLDKATGVENGCFTAVHLSTGQRKRLALAAALLEKRSFYVFDEWTADQDPEFRHIFFHELLPELKAEGATVIAVTHDDRYFDCGDVVIHMENGRIVHTRKQTRDPAIGR